MTEAKVTEHSAPPRRGAEHSPAAELPVRRPKATFASRFRQDRSLLFMVLPAAALVLVFKYVPMLGNIVAWQQYSPYVGITESPWVGWENFQRLLTDSHFHSAVINTVSITTFQLFFYFPIPIVMALLLNSVLTPWLRSTIQSIVYLPHFFSWVLVVTIFQQMLGGAGLLNRVLRDNDMAPVEIMTNPDTFLVLVTSEAVWKDAGWGMIIFLAALAAVDPTQYEAAAVDGAGGWQRMWHVTLPALKPVIILLLILRLGDTLTVGFEQILLHRDAIGRAHAEVVDTYVYYQGVLFGDWSFAAAAGLVTGVISLLLVLGANKLAHLFGEAGIYQKSGS
ncbi:MAG: ABC transporter permease [Brachybacterium sp.]|uniref:ABC transporter permease n=1 Tax=Brachybacterium sp. TaxID=1891286 RepID=UPI003F936525